MTRARLDEIVKGRRYRRDLGDIQALADSIRTVGLLHPPVVVHDRDGYRLVAGERRIAAARLLGWEEVEVTIAVGIADAKGLLAAERDENTCRLDFAPSEAVALAKRIEELERPKAKANSAANLVHRRRAEPSAQVGHSERVGRVADVAAAATGLGRETIRKAAAVVDATTDPNPEVQAAAQAAVAQMDTTGKVDPAYRAVTEALDAAQAPAGADEESQTIVLDGHNWTPSRQRGLEVAHAAMPDPVRIGMGMWTDGGPPIISPGAADWLVGHGYLARVEVRAGQQWVELIPAGSNAWDRLPGHADPDPAPEPRPPRSAAARAAEAERLHATGLDPSDIATRLGVARTTVLADLEPRLAAQARIRTRTTVATAARQLVDVVDAIAHTDIAEAVAHFDPDAEDGASWLDEIDRALQALARLRDATQPRHDHQEASS